MNKKVSLEDVAKEVGLSRATVSKIINNKEGVAPETRKKVIQALLRSGYKKIDYSLLTRDENMGIGITGLNSWAGTAGKYIAVLVDKPDFSPFWGQIINSISNTLSQQQSYLVYHGIHDSESPKQIVERVMGQGKIDAMIVINVYDAEITRQIQGLGLPVVFLDTCPELAREGLEGDLVLLEGYHSICKITENIIRQGRRKIGFIGDIYYSESIRHRWAGFSEALRRNQIEPNPRFICNSDPAQNFYDKASIYKALDVIWENPPDLPEAFVCVNDYIALIVKKYIEEKGLKIPQDIAVSGFDDIVDPLLEEAVLTTVALDTDYLGERLVRQVMMRIERPSMPSEVVHIEPNVVFRKSTEIV